MSFLSWLILAAIVCLLAWAWRCSRSQRKRIQEDVLRQLSVRDQPMTSYFLWVRSESSIGAFYWALHDLKERDLVVLESRPARPETIAVRGGRNEVWVSLPSATVGAPR